ncbi:MAG: hypothetical protein V2J07_01960 [Anaerolineae bacterium]|jgi:hypothetical protein|nr:hypothetical protein [Anaerolineae bacterium]
MDTDPKRMAQACRIYTTLLRTYPASFQQEYGDTLAQQFRDEYRDVLASGESLFCFWIFIGFDFISSLLMETQEEVVKMFKKKIFTFSAIAAGIFTPMFFFFNIAHYTYIDYRLNIPIWFQILIFTLVIGCGSLALLGMTVVTDNHLVFRILCLMVLIGSFSFLPIPGEKDPFVGRRWGTAIEFLGGNEDHAIVIPGYIFTIVLISIITLIKRKWLPGVLLVSMVLLPIVINGFAQLFSIDIAFLEYNQHNWYTTGFIVYSGIAWFVIAGWMWKKFEKVKTSEVIKAA